MVIQITFTINSTITLPMVDMPSMVETIIPEQLVDEAAGASAVAFLALTIPITVVLNLIASLGVVSAIGADAGWTVTFVAGSIATELSFLLVGLTYISLRSTFRVPTRLPNQDSLPVLAGGLVLSFATAFMSYVSTDAIFPTIEISPGFTQYTNFVAPTTAGIVLAVVLSLAVIGPVEEFFFRGVIQQRLSTSFATGTATAVASVVFAIFHVYPVLFVSPPLIAVAHMLLYYTLMGVIFGWVYNETDTLVAPALVHGIFNSTSFVIIAVA